MTLMVNDPYLQLPTPLASRFHVDPPVDVVCRSQREDRRCHFSLSSRTTEQRNARLFLTPLRGLLVDSPLCRLSGWSGTHRLEC